MANHHAYARYLSLFTLLLYGRVIGQLVVTLYAPSWLPPMAQWQSGLLPYPWLLAGQAVVLLLMSWITIDFAFGGFWIDPRPRLGRAAILWSYFYFAAMVIRYAVCMRLKPDQRWLGGTIPIVFHSVVAAFQWAFGTFHARQGRLP
jgi:hypothetical protein